MDYLRLTPSRAVNGSTLIVSKVGAHDESRELMRLVIDSEEDMQAQMQRLVAWALQMQVGLDLPFQKEMVTDEP